MNKKILYSEVGDLQFAKMEFPTWDLFKSLIIEAKQRNFPNSKLGSSPMACPDKTPIPVSGTPQLKSIIGGNVFIGIDVPVLLSPKDRVLGKTIIIVGESPLRNTKDFKNPHDILMGTPFAVHQEFSYPPQCNVYKKIFRDLLSEGYSIYLTDIIKVWWQGKKGREMKVNDVDKSIFRKEIVKIKSTTKGNLDNEIFIVAWGKTAENELNKIKEYKNKFKLMLHPGLMNWNNWKLHVFEKAVYDKGVDYAKNVYPNIGDPTTEVIVANEAVKEILEYCSKTNIK